MTEIESQIRKRSFEDIGDDEKNRNVFIRWDNQKKDWVYVGEIPKQLKNKPVVSPEIDPVEPC